MRVLSLFDGMACGMLAMQAAGIQVDRYVAYEIDKYAVQTSTHNFPTIEHRGDVFQADFTEYSGFDFLVGGSPCTYWSIAQKNNRETEASGMGWELFSQYVRALHEAQPQYFIYENNKSMSNAIRESITKAFGFKPICINSALVSAQNRQRLYWVGRRNLDGTYSRVKVEQPEDRGILLRDVLDGLRWRDKAYTIDSNYHKTLGQQGFERQSGRRKMVAEPVACRCRGRKDKDGNGYAKYECRDDAKANTLDTNTVNGSMVAVPVVPTVVKKLDAAVEKFGYVPEMWNPYNNAEITDKSPTLTSGCSRQTASSSVMLFEKCSEPCCDGGKLVDYTVREGSTIQITENNIHGLRKNGATESESFVYFENGKTNALTTGHIPKCITKIADPVRVCDDIVPTVIKKLDSAVETGATTVLATLPIPRYAIPIEFDGDIPIKAMSCTDGKTYSVYQVKDGYITIKGKQYPIKLADGFYIIRKMTVNECKRLQTVPEWYEFPVSDSQAYKMLGNGWTVEIISVLIRATQAGELEDEQLDLFKMEGK